MRWHELRLTHLSQRHRRLLLGRADRIRVDVLIERLVEERVKEEDARVIGQEIEHRADGEDRVMVLESDGRGGRRSVRRRAR